VSIRTSAVDTDFQPIGPLHQCVRQRRTILVGCPAYQTRTGVSCQPFSNNTKRFRSVSTACHWLISLCTGRHYIQSALTKEPFPRKTSVYWQWHNKNGEPSFHILYAGFHRTYPRNFMKISHMVQQIKWLKLVHLFKKAYSHTLTEKRIKACSTCSVQ